MYYSRIFKSLSVYIGPELKRKGYYMLKYFIRIFETFVITLICCLPCMASDKSPTDFPSTEYRIGLFQDLVLDIQKVTHIIVVGSAVKEDSDQFFQSGISRAYRYKELNPNDQVVIMSSPDVLNTTDDEVFEKYNIIVIQKVLEKFTADNMLNEMMAFPKIASFDFFGHSSPWAMKIGDSHAAFAPNEHYPQLRKLRNQFMTNSYATLNACNTGFTIAADLSEILKIPVSGALTSSVFERIESDSYWYKEDDWAKENYVNSNKYSYNQTFNCKLGVCNRMKPSRTEYNSVWGHFSEGGLSFNKFFCKFKNSNNRCEKGMANSLLSFPSVMPITRESTIEEFESVAYDWICSTAKDRKYFDLCVSGIQEAIFRKDLVFQTHPKNELMCDFYSCNANVICLTDSSNSPKLGSCHLDTAPNPEPTNAAREILSLTKGFLELQKDTSE